MKREELLEVIGEVDESLLAEGYKPACVRWPVLWKAAAAAALVALMSATVFGAVKLLSRPVNGGGIVTEGTISPITMIGGDVIPEPQVGLKVVMDVEVDGDAPEYLAEIFSLNPGAGWNKNLRSGVGNGFEYYSMTSVWTKGETSGEVRLTQTTVSGYVNGVNGEQVVDLLHELPTDTQVSAEVISLANREMLKVTIPPVELKGYVDQNVAYYRDGESRYYWTDGRYLFRMDCPSWVTEEEAGRMLDTLSAKPYQAAHPKNWGEILPEQLPELEQGVSVKGTTMANVVNTRGNALYSDGLFYFGDSTAIRIFEPATGEIKVLRTWEFSLPHYMFLAGSDICFSDSDLPRWGFYSMNEETGQIEAVFEGVSIGQLWWDGENLYGRDDSKLLKVDLSTGELVTLADNVSAYYVDDSYIYVIPKEGKYFLRSGKKDIQFEKVELSFQPVGTMAVDGETLYFVNGEQTNRRYQVIRWLDGEETALPIYGNAVQFLDNKLLFEDDREEGAVKSYDLATGEIEVLAHDVGDFYLFEDRYVSFEYRNDGWGILDWQTGELIKVEHYPK